MPTSVNSQPVDALVAFPFGFAPNAARTLVKSEKQKLPAGRARLVLQALRPSRARRDEGQLQHEHVQVPRGSACTT